MTEQKQAFQAFSFAVTPEEDAFNDVVAGGSFFDVGDHEVSIESQELTYSKAGNPMLVLDLSSGGKSIRHYVMLLSNKEGEEGKPNFAYKLLGTSLLNDKVLRMEFLGRLPAEPRLAAGLVNMRMGISVIEGDDGYTIKDVTDGKILFDVATQAQVPNTEIFPDYKTAKAHAEALGLNRCYNQIDSTWVTESDNDILAQKALDLVNKPVKAVKPARI